jgi:glycosyltransferase involved in cell wall biosynthesis
MNHLKILIVNDYAYIEGGAGKIATESAIKLAEKGHEVIFFSAVGPISEKLLKSKIKKVICLDQSDLIRSSNKLHSAISGVYNFGAVKKLKELLSEWKPDIVHFHGVSKALTWVPVKVVNSYKIPSVYTLHDFGLLCPNMSLYNFKTEKQCDLYENGKALKCLFTNCDKRSYLQKLWRYLRFHYTKDTLRIYSRIDGFIAVSNFVKEMFSGYLPANKKIMVISNPINKIDKAIIPEITKKRKTTFLYAGRLSAEKGLDLLMGAIMEVDADLTVAGDGEMLSLVKKTAGQPGNQKINVLGWLDEQKVYKQIQGCDAIILPSKVMEAAPTIISEAAGLGKPSIVANQGGALDFVKNNLNGTLFAAGDKNSLISAMQKYIDDPLLSDRLGKGARASFEESGFSNEKHIRELEVFYIKIINNYKA